MMFMDGDKSQRLSWKEWVRVQMALTIELALLCA